MVEFMTEQLVARKATATTTLQKTGLIALTVIIALVSFAKLPSFMPFIVGTVIILDVFLFNRMKVEYEYAYFSGDITIDRIYNKQSRKGYFATEIKEVDIIAPTNAPELRPYGQLKILDCSSRDPYAKTYTMVAMNKGQKVKVIFEPNQELLRGLKTAAPRKVFL